MKLSSAIRQKQYIRINSTVIPPATRLPANLSHCQNRLPACRSREAVLIWETSIALRLAYRSHSPDPGRTATKPTADFSTPLRTIGNRAAAGNLLCICKEQNKPFGLSSERCPAADSRIGNVFAKSLEHENASCQELPTE
jgi:hypothetical protein